MASEEVEAVEAAKAAIEAAKAPPPPPPPPPKRSPQSGAAQPSRRRASAGAAAAKWNRIQRSDDEEGSDSDADTQGAAVTDESRQLEAVLLNTEEPMERCVIVLELLEKRDPEKWFAEPVPAEIAPDYADCIAHPMDFATIRAGLAAGKVWRPARSRT